PVNVDTWVTTGSPLGWAVDLQAELPTWKEQLVTQVDQDVRQVIQGIADSIEQRLAFLRQKAEPLPHQTLPVNVVQLPPKALPTAVQRWFNIFDRRDPVACGGGFTELIGSLEVGETFLYQDQERAFDISIATTPARRR